MATRRAAKSLLDGLIVNPSLRLELTYQMSVRGVGRARGQLTSVELVRAAWLSVLGNLDDAGVELYRKLGLLVEPHEAPRDVRLRCQLGRQRPRLTPYPDRLGYDESVPASALGLIRAHRLQRDGVVPPDVAKRVGLVEFLDGDGTVLWVEDPGTRIWAPYHLGRDVAQKLERIGEQRLSAAALPGEQLDALRRAHVLVPKQYAAQQRKSWSRKLETATAYSSQPITHSGDHSFWSQSDHAFWRRPIPHSGEFGSPSGKVAWKPGMLTDSYISSCHRY